MEWNLYSENKFLQPLCFSNGKSQNDVVNEILDLINKGKKIIFVHGVCGTGKSAIALNLALSKGKTSIVVPGKNLQAQYKRDYEGKKYLIKPDGTKLKISIITGRNNHKCKFLEDSKNAIPKIKKETNASLYDIFVGKKEEFKDKYGQDISADNKELPCKIEIKDSNWARIKEYLKQNRKVDIKNFSKIRDVKRLSIAPVCPYWSPVYPEQYELKSLTNAKKRTYLGLENTEYVQYKRTPGCPFYEQFDSYIDSDVIVFNSLKYKLETAMNRKPKTQIEVIDECDEFLDSLSNQRVINIERLQASLIQALGSGEGDEDTIDELLELIKYLKRDPKFEELSSEGGIIDIKSTQVFDIVKIFLREHWLKTVDDENYLFDILETAKMFKDFLNETYLTVIKKDNNFLISLVTTNLAKKLKEYVDKNEVLVLMSGTLHSEKVLRNIFGLDSFETVDAETKDQGSIIIKRTGLEMDCKYSNFSSKKYSRKDYLLALNESVKVAKRPTLVHVNAFLDMPSEEEIKKYSLNSLISREELKFLQLKDKTGKLTTEFKEGKREILFSTRDSRGVDFPGDECNSIIFTKYPNPNVKDAFWKILMKTKPQYYWEFYRDKAKREFLQKIYRGLRFKEDKVELLSPDIRVLNLIEKEKGFNVT